MWRKGQVSSGIRFVALKRQRLQRHLCVQPQDSAVSSLPLRPPVPSPWFQVLGVLLWTGRVDRSCAQGYLLPKRELGTVSSMCERNSFSLDFKGTGRARVV